MTIMEKDNNKPEIKIEIIEDGPLNITGPIIYKDLKRDITVNMDDVSLCLCGRSKNKPFCDDSHLSRIEEEA
jgi:CDGSH-type Zn-finger protein